MNETAATRTSTRGEAAIIHLALVGVSFFVSYLLMQRVGLMPGEVLEFMAIGVLLVHAVAAIVGILIRRVSVASCLMVFAAAFLPCGGCLSFEQIQKEIKYRYQLPYDRFRDNLGSPIPESVTNLRFVPLDEHISPDLMFQFDIDPADLDTIMDKLQMKRVDPTSMLNPTDFFQHPYYMPIEGTYHLFQGKDKYEGVLTIKTNEAHSHAIFRHESSNFYRDRSWETRPSIQIQMDTEALEKMKRKYGK